MKMNEPAHELEVVGDALQRAWRADHDRCRRAHQRRFRLALVFVLSVVFVAASVAVASSVWKSASDEEQGLLGGHLLFKGTEPRCQQLTASSYSCVLARPPTEMTFYREDGRPRAGAYLGVKTATVDAHKRVDGGCVATSGDGRKWRCYLGEEAVRNGIVSRDFLGESLPEPPAG
jgi:hypothetical protein